MAGHPDFDALLTTTIANYRNKLVDNVFNDRPLLDFLKRKDKIRMEDGGESIVEQLLYGENSTFGSYEGYDTLDITPQEGLTAAVFPWKQFATTIAINGAEEAKNNGKAKLLSLLKSKVMQAEQSAASGLTRMLFSDGSGNGGKDFGGLVAVVNDHTGPVTTVGGIDCTAAGNEWWRSVVIDAAADDDDERSNAEWTNAFYTASKGNDAPDFVITTQELFEHYEGGLVDQIRYVSSEEADARFQTLAFKGRRLYFDLECPEGETYFLNSRYLNIVGMSSRWFKNTPFREVPDKDAKWSQLLGMGNLTCNNRARQAVVKNQNTTDTIA
jgi:hypothetical protein